MTQDLPVFDVPEDRQPYSVSGRFYPIKQEALARGADQGFLGIREHVVSQQTPCTMTLLRPVGSLQNCVRSPEPIQFNNVPPIRMQTKEH